MDYTWRDGLGDALGEGGEGHKGRQMQWKEKKGKGFLIDKLRPVVYL